MKKQLMIWMTVFVLFSIARLGFAADTPVFGLDSANITNSYVGFIGQEGTISIGCPNTPNEGQVYYLDVIGVEDLDGIKCLKINAVSQNQLLVVWLAQDTEGTVWTLKVFVPGSGYTFTLGNGIESPFMPANPEVGDRAGFAIPESDQYHCRIAETDVDVPQTCWGMGPNDGFTGCVRIQCGEPPGYIEEDNYFCPDFGQVKYSTTSGWAHQLKEIIWSSCPPDFDKDGEVDGSDLATFAEEFGKTCPQGQGINDIQSSKSEGKTIWSRIFS